MPESAEAGVPGIGADVTGHGYSRTLNSTSVCGVPAKSCSSVPRPSVPVVFCAGASSRPARDRSFHHPPLPAGRRTSRVSLRVALFRALSSTDEAALTNVVREG